HSSQRSCHSSVTEHPHMPPFTLALMRPTTSSHPTHPCPLECPLVCTPVCPLECPPVCPMVCPVVCPLVLCPVKCTVECPSPSIEQTRARAHAPTQRMRDQSETSLPRHKLTCSASNETTL
uniref:Uncharacterized protein n=1 Tax=Periophthalmus magnuspinnatus TaxID=409849 RepID=A0A3B4AGL6_9GOBI